MCDFKISLFGHREINDLRDLENKLIPIIKELIRKKAFVSFLIGRNGEFDEYTASLIKRIQRQEGKETSEMSLVIPYKLANLEYYEKYYDNIIIPEKLYGAHPKSAIELRNRWMVEVSDLVIVYVENENGGAYKAMKYAEKLNKNIINLCKISDFEN